MIRVVPPEEIIQLVAQIKEDQVKFPIIAVTRNEDTPIDMDRMNFTWAHRGVATVFNNETNELYYEKILPVIVTGALTILDTNTQNVEELIRELMFKYLLQYFITLQLPYESKRKIRFGMVLDPAGIKRSSGDAEYLSSGKLHQSIIPFRLEGAVLVSYTPQKLQQFEHDIIDNH